MNKRNALWWIALIAMPLAAQDPAVRPDRAEHRVGADFFVAGGTVSITEPVAGDLVTAGGNVDVSAGVGGDLFVAGGNARLGSAVKQSVYAIGGRVAINAPVLRNLRAGGGNVEIGPQARIAGNATLGGGNVQVLGPIDGYLQVGGGSIRIDAPVGGDVEASGGRIELGPNARITGKLRYSSQSDLERNPAAQVQGGVERGALPGERATQSGGHRGTAHEGRGIAWVWSTGLLFAAALLAAALPTLSSALGETLSKRWQVSLLTGFVAMVCIPVAALIALITIIGAPIGLALLTLYPFLLFIGYVFAGVAVGEIILRRFAQQQASRSAWRIGAAVLGMLAISLFARLPWLGGLVVLLALWAGLGSLLLQWRRNAGDVAGANI